MLEVLSNPKVQILCCAAVEPAIGDLKKDHRMDRDYQAHRRSDLNNAVLAAEGYNFRDLLRWLRISLRFFLIMVSRAGPEKGPFFTEDSLLFADLTLDAGFVRQDAAVPGQLASSVLTLNYSYVRFFKTQKVTECSISNDSGCSCIKRQWSFSNDAICSCVSDDEASPRVALIRPCQASRVNGRETSNANDVATSNPDEMSTLYVVGIPLLSKVGRVYPTPFQVGLYFNTSSSLLFAIELSPGSHTSDMMASRPSSLSIRARRGSKTDLSK